MVCPARPRRRDGNRLWWFTTPLGEHSQAIGGERVSWASISTFVPTRGILSRHTPRSSISTIEGNSIAPVGHPTGQSSVFEAESRVLVILDSNHTLDHVAAELSRVWRPRSVGSSLIVMDTVIRDMAPETLAVRPWDSVNNPWTAVRDFLKCRRRIHRGRRRERPPPRHGSAGRRPDPGPLTDVFEGRGGRRVGWNRTGQGCAPTLRTVDIDVVCICDRDPKIVSPFPGVPICHTEAEFLLAGARQNAAAVLWSRDRRIGRCWAAS